MKLIQEIVNQVDLKTSDGSDAGSKDVVNKGAEVKFDLMRNTINSDGKVKGSDVANYLEKAHELNDEVETVLYGLETSDGKVVKVYVNASQADAFEAEMKKMLGMEDDIEEAINNLASQFDIVDVIWPKDDAPAADGDDAPADDEVTLDDAVDIGDPADDEDEDDDLETIASLDDDIEGANAPVDDDEPIEGEEDAPAPKKKSKDDEAPVEDDASSDDEAPAEDEATSDDDVTPDDEEGDKKDDKKKSGDKKGDKNDKKGDKHNLLKQIGGGLAGKAKVTEGEVINADFSKGKGVDNQGIEVPKGYDRFEVDGKKIVGIKGDKQTVVSITTDERLAQELVRVYNGGKASTSMKPLTMLQAFGSREVAAADAVGIKLTEKPSYWEDFEEGGSEAHKNIDQVKLKRLEKTVGKLKEYSGKDIYGTDEKPLGPLKTVMKMPAEDMFIVRFSDGTRYVADQTGARTYIRMWQKIN